MKKEFKRFFLTIARYMQNNDADVTFCNDGSIVLTDINTGFKQKFSHLEVVANVCKEMAE